MQLVKPNFSIGDVGDSVLERFLARPVLQSFLYAPSSITHFERPIILPAFTINLNEWYSMQETAPESTHCRNSRRPVTCHVAMQHLLPGLSQIEPATHASSIVQSLQTQLILFLLSETLLIPLLLSLHQFPQP
ncbi:hypothetical protein IW261DRAFT_1573882 [Armillaria novae-zelandiae]|uniref:Uncharacterized protein n=1 Tax=Armillaria novae-zelandiae TaxID=153914 RepID=A0AA39T6E2_9AGAR|nr:hypothetical protein IW261DRAFT_1573882 [Armillaria novae-zelandiae]